MKKIPVIDVTDLYHPAQDPGDNFDILMPYGLPEIDLRAVVLDATDRYRHAFADHEDPRFRDANGPREPGFIPMLQLNCLFGKDVPFAAGPFRTMRSTDDTLADVPQFQQQGIRLLLDTLRQSEERIHLLSFGSARTIAAAFNREPDLFYAKVERIHLAAGSSSPDFLEWNVNLDSHAFVRLLRSDLPIALYPCATAEGAFDYGPHNSYWLLKDLQFIKQMEPRLRRYLEFAFARMVRMDFLSALEANLPDREVESVYGQPHHVWETAVWLQVSGRRCVRRQSGAYRIVPANEVMPTDETLPDALRACKVQVSDRGTFRFELTEEPSNFLIYDRGDALLNERALNEALPALYQSFRPGL
ncbi:hypothetical protein [Cohnella nanjingensis]|uniref:Inosine/uridine-preferring nucleoside hydrolase domain-containing protein n=1 Tax=Cohnella nanjingensis TaxID=1387779 RepID=A0A7X0RU47_9BACL|nr:hypothetical protein [Cohnella nanjingensis]MBB6672526.1 hypothetical protein [Cohnella nanjingensis]